MDKLDVNARQTILEEFTAKMIEIDKQLQEIQKKLEEAERLSKLLDKEKCVDNLINRLRNTTNLML